MALKLTAANFQEEVLDSELPVLVDFFATWCGPCQAAGPVIDELAETYRGKVKMGKIDVDQDQALAQKHGVMSIPTVILFKKGKEFRRITGFPGKAGYEKLIKEAHGA